MTKQDYANQAETLYKESLHSLNKVINHPVVASTQTTIRDNVQDAFRNFQELKKLFEEVLNRAYN